MPSRITSPSNPRVKTLARLQRQSSLRREAGAFCIETQRELSRALAGGFEVNEVYALTDSVPPELSKGTQVIEVSPAVLDKITYRENPEGFVAVMADRRATLDALDIASPELILVASGLEKPGNLGAIMRSADLVGASALFIDVPPERVDLFNPNVIRASTGAVFSLPIVCAPPEELNDWLTGRGVLKLAATPEAVMSYTMLHLRGAVAWIVGSEAEGLGAFWREHADLAVSIPTPGSASGGGGGAADSLNVAQCATVLLFETARQRRG